MYQKAVETVEKYNMINDGDSIVVGLSGGADSCALTMFLAGLIKKYGIKITAVHINHGIRGAEADSDEAFARAFCDRLGVDFTAYHCDVPAEAKKKRHRRRRSRKACEIRKIQRDGQKHRGG